MDWEKNAVYSTLRGWSGDDKRLYDSYLKHEGQETIQKMKSFM
jgi:hypothetical protein